MSSIGPQLPPSLSKRKRSTEDQGGIESPPAKVHAAGPQLPSNTDEIALAAESSDDEYGPSIGPTLPPSNTNEIALDDSDDDDYGPAAPASGSSIGPLGPPAAGPAAPPSSRSAGPTLPPHASEPEATDAAQAPAPAAAPKRVHGPAPPPAALSERPEASDASDSDSDDDYGPALPSSSAHQARQSEATARAARAAAESAAKGPQRDDWMLAPPTAGGGYREPDPTKLKARKFNSGPRSGGGGASDAGGGGGISSIWTETPEQKRKRLEDAVLGRGGADAAAPSRPPPTTQSREDEERAAEIRDKIERARGPSLYAAHQARDGGKGGRIEEEEDDPSKRGFDREKDMKVGGRIGAAQRKELLNKAADFGGRFSKGKFL